MKLSNKLNPIIETNVNSFGPSPRVQRFHSMNSYTPTATSIYPPTSSGQIHNFESRSENDFNSAQPARSLSPEDLRRMKYKVELDKQVAEKKERLAREWETKMQRDRKYVQHQPFGQHGDTIINKGDLEEIITKARAPSPVIDMPQQLPLNYPQQSYMPNGNNTYGSSPQGYNNYPQYQMPNMQAKPPSPQKNDYSQNNNYDFQRFYGPKLNGNGVPLPPSTSGSGTSGTAQPIKGDAHDPFLLYDPNKEGQNVFNVIPQQDLYDPWGRPGGGAPLIHQPTGQKFTRYSGSLQEKLSKPGKLGFYRKQYSSDIEEKKREVELEQQRRFHEELEHRSNAGDTAEWISQLEGNRYPLRLHLPTTQPTREYIGARERYRYDESRALHNDLVRQAEERNRLQQLSRYQKTAAELQHTEAQNNWWGRGGGGAPTYSNRRHNVQASLENPRQKWTVNHLGQLVIADDGQTGEIKVSDSDYYYPKTKGFSSHRNYYEAPAEENKS